MFKFAPLGHFFNGKAHLLKSRTAVLILTEHFNRCLVQRAEKTVSLRFRWAVAIIVSIPVRLVREKFLCTLEDCQVLKNGVRHMFSVNVSSSGENRLAKK